MRNAAVLVAAIAAGSIQTFTLGAIEAEAAAAPPTRVVVLADPGIAAPPAAVAVRIDDRSSDEIAKALRALPAGERMLFSDRLLATLFDHARDRVIVRGHLTDHASPWPTNGVEAVAAEMRRLAEDLRRLDAAPDTLIVIGDLPLRFETIDAAGESYWMAVRNDPRFAAERSETFHLTGTITSGSEQALQWDAFLSRQAHGALFEAVQRPIVAAFPTIELAWASQEAAAIPTAPPPNLFGTVRSPRFDATYPLTAAAETSTWEVFRAAVQRADADASLGAMLPLLSARSDGGTRVRRLALAGTPLWDELARHLLLRSGGRLVVDNRRGGERAAEDAKLLATIAGEIDPLRAGSARHLDGDGFVATGAATAAGDTLWRVTLAPGVRSILLDLGTDEPMRISAGADGGAWFRSGGSAAVEVAALDRAPSTARSGSGRVISVTGEPVPGGVELLNPVLANWSGAGFGDLNGDGVIDGADLAIWLAGQPGGGSWTGTPFGDLNGDGVINGADLAIWLAGQPGGWQGTPYGDLDGDGTVGGADLAIWLAGHTGPDGWQGTPYGDLDGNGTVGGADLAIWLAGQGGATPPPPVKITLRPGGIDLSNGETAAGWESPGTDPNADDPPSSPPPSGQNPSGGVDPTLPITPSGSSAATADPRPPLPVPVSMSDSLLETAGPSLYVVPGYTEQIAELGTVPLRIIYGNDDPDRHQGLINAAFVISKVEAAWGTDPYGWFMLDYEVPHFTHLARGLDDPNDPLYIATRDSFVSALEQLKARFPRTRWTVYGVPAIPSWFQHNGSAITLRNAAPELLETAILAPRRELYRAIVDASDWVSPSIYVRHDSRNYSTPAGAESNSLNFQIRNRLMTETSKRLVAESAHPDRPVIPLINLYFAPGGNAQQMREIPIDQVVDKMIEPAFVGGADSIAIWTGAGFYARLATVPPNPSRYQPIVRAANVVDYLEGQTPANWHDGELRAFLLTRYAEAIQRAVEAITAAGQSANPAMP